MRKLLRRIKRWFITAEPVIIEVELGNDGEVLIDDEQISTFNYSSEYLDAGFTPGEKYRVSNFPMAGAISLSTTGYRHGRVDYGDLAFCDSRLGFYFNEIPEVLYIKKLKESPSYIGHIRQHGDIPYLHLDNGDTRQLLSETGNLLRTAGVELGLDYRFSAYRFDRNCKRMWLWSHDKVLRYYYYRLGDRTIGFCESYLPLVFEGKAPDEIYFKPL